ncbi:hypothetical protein D3C79_970500 [compost metagenome]
MEKSMIFGIAALSLKISRYSAADSSMKPAITPPWIAGSNGLPILSWLAGRQNSRSSP